MKILLKADSTASFTAEKVLPINTCKMLGAVSHKMNNLNRKLFYIHCIKK